MGMRLKGETIDEITGAVLVMRELATGVDVSGDNLVDISGRIPVPPDKDFWPEVENILQSSPRERQYPDRQ